MTIEPGIRRTKCGWEVYGRNNGRFVSRRFALDTPLEQLRQWRSGMVTGQMCPLLPTVPTPPAAEEGGFVYFVQCREFVKVGKARDISRRIEELQTAHPEPLRLVAFMRAKFPSKIEAEILREYRESAARGEWFRITPDIERLVRHHGKMALERGTAASPAFSAR